MTKCPVWKVEEGARALMNSAFEDPQLLICLLFMHSQMIEWQNHQGQENRILKTSVSIMKITCGPFGAPPNTQVLRIREELPKSPAVEEIC